MAGSAIPTPNSKCSLAQGVFLLNDGTQQFIYKIGCKGIKQVAATVSCCMKSCRYWGYMPPPRQPTPITWAVHCWCVENSLPCVQAEIKSWSQLLLTDLQQLFFSCISDNVIAQEYCSIKPHLLLPPLSSNQNSQPEVGLQQYDS